MNQLRNPIQMRFHLTRQQLLNSTNGSIGSATYYVSRAPNSIEYNVNVFPNGRSPAESGRFLVFLQFKFPENITIFSSFHFTVGSTMQRSFHHSYKTSSSFGGILCPRQLLFHPTSMLVNDRLLIELFGHVVIQRQPLNPRIISVRANMNQSSSNSPKPKEDLSHRMPAPPLIVRKEKEKSLVETAKTETELNVARILQNHLEEERRTPKNGDTPHTPPKTEQPVAVKNVEKTVTNDENVTPIVVKVSKGADESDAVSENQTKVTEPPSNIHKPSPPSLEPRPNSETTETDSHPNDSSSSATNEEPNRNKRVRTRTSRYVEYFVEGDDVVEEPLSKKYRKRKSIPGQSPNTSLDGNDEYVPPRRSKSVARLSTAEETYDRQIDYDCQIVGVEKTFDVNRKMLAEKSKGFTDLFDVNSDSIIELEGIPDRTLEAAFNYCHGLPFKDMNNRECYSLLLLSHSFEMPALKNVLEEILMEKISLTNACDIINAAITAEAEKLKNECKKYIVENLRNKATLRNYIALNKKMKDEISAELAKHYSK